MGHNLSKCISTILRPCSYLVGKLPQCCNAKKISKEDQLILSNEIQKHSQPGDFILSHIDKRPSNIFLGGAPYTHMGIITGDYIIDMISKGATKRTIHDWIAGKDRILIIRANIQDTEKIAQFARNIYESKTPYDFSFEIDSEAIYCTELGYLALRSISEDLPVQLGISPTVTGGLLYSTTFRANSFITSLKYNKIIPVLEWRYDDEDIFIQTEVDINRLLLETDDPLEASEKSGVLFKLTKMAYPFNKSRIELITENESLEKSCLPNAKLRANRDKYNRKPHGDLHEVETDTHFPFRVFRDSITREVYVVFPQTSNLFHCPCKWTKLVSFDAVHGIPEALGSTEILVPNYIMSGCIIPKEIIKLGSYNYRDSYVAGRAEHCCLDIFGCCK